MFLLWLDDNPRKPTPQKIAEAMQAYADRFQSQPNTVFCNEAELCDIPGVLVRSEGYIRVSNFWVGNTTTEGERDHAELKNRMDPSHV